MANSAYNIGGYKIEKVVESETMREYFLVYCMRPTPSIIGPQFDTLKEAEECVRLCKRDVYFYW